MVVGHQANNRKLLIMGLLALMFILIVGTVLWYRQNTQEEVLLKPAPLWYNIISTKSFSEVGAATGFKVDLKKFRQYGGDISLKPRPSQPDKTGLITDKCDHLTKWAVITTIAPETTTTITVLLDSKPDYCLVVVGDRKSPRSYTLKTHHDRFVYLTIEDQASLPLELVALTPENSFARKSIGFLYAIANGAKVILDMDDDNVPIKLNDKFFPIEEKVGVFDSPKVDIATEGPVWNPYPYYGLPEAWPRGFPLNRIVPLDRKLMKQRLECKPVVQQYMANRDPDVDAVYRLTHPLPAYFESDRKSMVLPHGVYCPYNAQATIHLYEAFWSMLLPQTVNGRVSDIWRSYVMQYITTYIPDTCVMFAPPAVRHERNSHNYLMDYHSELPLYTLAPHLVDMLVNTPPQAAPLEVVLRNTYLMFYELGVLEVKDVRYVIAWINDLNKVGYQFPKLE